MDQRRQALPAIFLPAIVLPTIDLPGPFPMLLPARETPCVKPAEALFAMAAWLTRRQRPGVPQYPNWSRRPSILLRQILATGLRRPGTASVPFRIVEVNRRGFAN